MIEQVLTELTHCRGKFPEEAMAWALEHRAEITPALINIIDDTRKRAYELTKDYEYVGHMTAMYLLAHFRETSAYRPIVRLFSLSDDLPYTLTADFLFESFPRVLASVCGGKLFLIKRLIQDPEIDEKVRSAALRALVVLFAAGEMSRMELVAYFRSLFHGGLEPVYSDVRDELIFACVDIHPAEFIDDIMKCFDDGLVDEFMLDRDDVMRCLAEDKDALLQKLRTSRLHSLIDDAATEAARFYEDPIEPSADSEIDGDDEDLPHASELWPDDEEDYEDDEEYEDYDEYKDDGRHVDLEPFLPPRPEYRTVELPKIGRNDPCPCGSGKKFKKCCGDPKLQDDQ